MKSTAKRHSHAEMKRFIYALAEALVPGGEPAFYVNATSSKNRFFFRVKDASNNFYYLSYNRWRDDLGTFGSVDALFKETNPRIMLREQVVSIEELVNEFNLDEKKLVRAVFNRIDKAVKDAIKTNFGDSSKMQFTAQEDLTPNKIANRLAVCKDDDAKSESTPESTPEVSSIDELIVWADLKAGMH